MSNTIARGVSADRESPPVAPPAPRTAVQSLLDEVTQDRSHQIRQAFDRATLKLSDNLKTDPLLAEKAEGIKA